MNDKERVVNRLLGKSVLILREEYYKIEDQIIDILSTKKNWSEPCDCKGVPQSFPYIDEGTELVIHICLECGGDVK